MPRDRRAGGDQQAAKAALDLALEAADLVPENQSLKSELGLRVAPIDEGIEE